MKIKQGKPGFSYGNCFVVAIGQAFNIKQPVLRVMFELIGGG